MSTITKWPHDRQPTAARWSSFVIGMRINHFHKVGKWLPVFRVRWGRCWGSSIAQPRERLSGHRIPCYAICARWCCCNTGAILTALEAYARAREQKHWPAWTAFNKAIGSDGTVGIFHETYVVPAHASETVYANMVPFGLGKVSGVVPATGSRNEARSR